MTLGLLSGHFWMTLMLVPQESMLVPQEPILENVIFNYMHGWIMYAEDVWRLTRPYNPLNRMPFPPQKEGARWVVS